MNPPSLTCRSAARSRQLHSASVRIYLAFCSLLGVLLLNLSFPPQLSPPSHLHDHQRQSSGDTQGTIIVRDLSPEVVEDIQLHC